MDPSEIETLVARLVANPHDEEALAYAHQAGAVGSEELRASSRERVGNETTDPAYASHWLSEAANVWLTALGDAHRAARTLMDAIDKDPTQQVAADTARAALSRQGRHEGARRAARSAREGARAARPRRTRRCASRSSAMHEELGRLWSEPPLSQPRKAIEQLQARRELDPQNALAIFSRARAAQGARGSTTRRTPLYDAELAIESDTASAASRSIATKPPCAARPATSRARRACWPSARDGRQDPGLQQELRVDRPRSRSPAGRGRGPVGARQRRASSSSASPRSTTASTGSRTRPAALDSRRGPRPRDAALHVLRAHARAATPSSSRSFPARTSSGTRTAHGRRSASRPRL